MSDTPNLVSPAANTTPDVIASPISSAVSPWRKKEPPWNCIPEEQAHDLHDLLNDQNNPYADRPDSFATAIAHAFKETVKTQGSTSAHDIFFRLVKASPSQEISRQASLILGILEERLSKNPAPSTPREKSSHSDRKSGFDKTDNMIAHINRHTCFRKGQLDAKSPLTERNPDLNWFTVVDAIRSWSSTYSGGRAMIVTNMHLLFHHQSAIYPDFSKAIFEATSSSWTGW